MLIPERRTEATGSTSEYLDALFLGAHPAKG